jgi:hypothetical protein
VPGRRGRTAADTAAEPQHVLYVATVHYRSPRWIEIQTAHLREHISVPMQIWTSLEGIDPSYGRHFDRVLEQRGLHAAKLNHMAMEICHVASEEDLLMFLDGDAFPIADPLTLVTDALRRAPLLAVRRAENAQEPQPHPCFCVTTVGAWERLHGDWCAGYTWLSPRGTPTSDVGGNLLRRLELEGEPWVPVLRSNRHDIDPLYFAIYGGVVYHHGAGFRTGELSPAHRALAPAALPRPRLAPLRLAVRALNGLRWRRWERATERRHVRQSEEMYARIRAGGSDWLRALA